MYGKSKNAFAAAASSQQPAASSQQPAASSQQPAAVGDRVRWKGKRAMGIVGSGYSAGDIVGTVRSIKLEPYSYAVIAAEPYGNLYMPPLQQLERVEPLAEKVAAVIEKGVK